MIEEVEAWVMTQGNSCVENKLPNQGLHIIHLAA